MPARDIFILSEYPLFPILLRIAFLHPLLTLVIIAGLVVEYPMFLNLYKIEIQRHDKIINIYSTKVSKINIFLQKADCKNMDYRIGHGYDVHRLQEGLELWLGGIQVPHNKGCVAHSDGDAPIHALCDAILGALAMGDIGKHFPDTSDKYKNIDSKILLEEVMKMAEKEGYQIGNADITIVLQKPKIAPYIDKMRTILATLMKTDEQRVSVKATTSENLGFAGREEGVEAHAVVLLRKI